MKESKLRADFSSLLRAGGHEVLNIEDMVSKGTPDTWAFVEGGGVSVIEMKIADWVQGGEVKLDLSVEQIPVLERLEKLHKKTYIVSFGAGLLYTVHSGKHARYLERRVPLSTFLGLSIFSFTKIKPFVERFIQHVRATP